MTLWTLYLSLLPKISADTSFTSLGPGQIKINKKPNLWNSNSRACVSPVTDHERKTIFCPLRQPSWVYSKPLWVKNRALEWHVWPFFMSSFSCWCFSRRVFSLFFLSAIRFSVAFRTALSRWWRDSSVCAAAAAVTICLNFAMLLEELRLLGTHGSSKQPRFNALLSILQHICTRRGSSTGLFPLNMGTFGHWRAVK